MAVVLGTSSGFVSVAPTADPNGTAFTIDGASVVTKHTAPAGATKIIQVGWYRSAGTNTANFEIALYSDSAGVAATRLFVDATNSSSASGWINTTVDWAITPGTAYWLGLQMDAHTGSSSGDLAASGGAGSDTLASQTTLANPYGGGAVADADGMYAIYALWEQPATGTGALAAQAADVGGAGTSRSTGTGSLASQAATADGSGTSASTGTGALTSQAASADGAGTSASTGTGALASSTADLVGEGEVTGDSSITGTGALVAQAASTDGAGTSASSGAGTLAAQSAQADGAGTSASTGTGALSASVATSDGSGVSGSEGAGDLEAQNAAVSGSAGAAAGRARALTGLG
jgi:hypothetical protein